ncbi:unnamed protein product [Microthlaspi erraticum]|uniref:F-box domain-containing protein n=1 Tax=Microthlaspi erraticum TaxID=1685480 RepID=A0A6D2IZT0_9BRAS|nr:unnamed protein product [Microthlaspi erraticum]
MSTTTASNTNEPPPPNNDDPPQPPSVFSTLPVDIVLNILARVPRNHHPMLSCVSKNFRSLVRSSELHMTLSLQGNDDSFYVCFRDFDSPSLTYHWFTLDDDQRRLVSVPFPSPPEPNSAALMIGHEIYLVGGYRNHSCRSIWILDSRSAAMRKAPRRHVACCFPAVGLVDEKIYMFGGHQDEHNEIQAEVFDTKTQTWDVAPNPDMRVKCVSMSAVNPSLDSKIYVRDTDGQVIVYDPSDGKCEKIYDVQDDVSLWSQDVCVIDNVRYIYQECFGLMWYDSEDMEWREVTGYKLGYCSANRVTLAEYKGKLAFIRECYCSTKKKTEIWCVILALEREGDALEIVGEVEWAGLILSVPHGYEIMHCLGRTD